VIIMSSIHNFLSFFGRIFAITKDEYRLQNIDKQAKVFDLERQIDPVRCLLSNGVDQFWFTNFTTSPVCVRTTHRQAPEEIVEGSE